LVVDVTGLKDAPDGPVNDTAAPDTAAPDEFFNDADTVAAPEATTWLLGVDTLRRLLDAANAGEPDTITIAGTDHAAPATTARRLTPAPSATRLAT
jgi:hypothetical protein